MNKMIVNHLEKLFVTSDAATIMKELDVVHPAAKVIVLNAGQQESEVSAFLVVYIYIYIY
jgi:T-complex protein 1 subunit theta